MSRQQSSSVITSNSSTIDRRGFLGAFVGLGLLPKLPSPGTPTWTLQGPEKRWKWRDPKYPGCNWLCRIRGNVYGIEQIPDWAIQRYADLRQMMNRVPFGPSLHNINSFAEIQAFLARSPAWLVE